MARIFPGYWNNLIPLGDGLLIPPNLHKVPLLMAVFLYQHVLGLPLFAF